MVLMKPVCLYGLVLLGETLAQTTTSIFFGANFIGTLDASIAGSSGDETTYVLSCQTIVSDCNGLLYGEPSLTVTAGPSTMTYSASTSAGGGEQETTRVCTGTGSPVTAGICTIYSVEGPSTASYVQTLSPAGGSPYYQAVILGGSASGGVSSSTPASTTAAGTTKGSGSSSSTPTQTIATTTAATTTAATTTAASTTSKNAARKTDSPWPILAGAGVLAAVIGL